MSDNAIDVSFVMTVYNKEYYLPSVLKALLNQTGLKNPEYIFVDDLSSDRSVEIIREMTQGIPNVKIIANKETAASAFGLIRESPKPKANIRECLIRMTFSFGFNRKDA